MGVGGVEGEGEGEGVDVNVVLVVVVDAFRGLKKKFHLIFTFSGAKKCYVVKRHLVFGHSVSLEIIFENFCSFRNYFCSNVGRFFESFFLFSPFLKLKCQLEKTRATIFKLNLSFQIF